MLTALLILPLLIIAFALASIVVSFLLQETSNFLGLGLKVDIFVGSIIVLGRLIIYYMFFIKSLESEKMKDHLEKQDL